MSLKIQSFILGPLQNRTILLVDEDSRKCIIVDPASGVEQVLNQVQKNRYQLDRVLITHAHFDHIAGVSTIFLSIPGGIAVHIHPLDLPLWNFGGGAKQFGLTVDTDFQVEADLDQNTSFKLGDDLITVRFTPGHTPGHVIFYLPESNLALVGDLIFHLGVGRTDLPGGDGHQLLQSIKNQVLTLPDKTILYPGHGLETTVGFEKKNNPFLAG